MQTSYRTHTILLSCFAVCAVLAMSGCALETTAGPISFSPSAFSGHLMGGHQPITGATVTLYAATSGDGTATFDPGSGAAVYGGYAGAPIVLGTATTEDGTGTHGAGYFSITRNGNICQDGANDQVYIVSNNGNPKGGLATDTASYNPAAYLVAALGPCNTVTASTTVLMNEATTAAAAYGLSGFAKFAADGSIGIGTSTTNKLGLAHAFANAMALVNTVNGQSQTMTTAGNGTINSTVVNTVSNALAQCVNSSGVGSPACSSLFVAYPTANSATTLTPTTTWQLALGIAQYPAVNTSGIQAAGTVAPQFYGPSLAATPNDYSVAITYVANLQGSTTKVGAPWDIKADNNDNVWISTDSGGGLTELSSTGVQQTLAQSTTLATDVNLRSVAIETGSAPRIWVADFTGTAFAYTQAATATTSTAAVALPSSVTVNGTATTASVAAVGLAIDNGNNVFYATRNGSTNSPTNLVGEIPFNATTPAAKTSYAVSPFQATNQGSYYAAADGKTAEAGAGYVLAPSQNNATLPVYTAPFTGAFNSVATNASGGTNDVAFDGNGSEWIVIQGSGANGGKLQKCPVTSTSCATALAGPVGGTVGLYAPRAIVIDGNGRLFVTSYTTFGIVEYDTTAGYVVNGSTGILSPSLAITAANPRNATIDHSGALWISNGTGSTAQLALQVLGLAAPTDPVLANGNYGAKP